MQTKLTHHHLSAEAVNDEHGKAIMLTQQEDGYNEPNTVLVHPWQLRAVCEQFGIIASDPQAAKTIATLQRRMKALHVRIEALADWMARHSEHRHADLSYETTQLHALQDLAREWCADFDDEQAAPGIGPETTAVQGSLL
jgi:hypothetical protein